MNAKFPFDGIRVIELTTAWAGPFCSKNLAYMGAEVIKVEAPLRPDSTRGNINPAPGSLTVYPKGVPGERPWDRAASYHERHRNKLSLILDLTSPEGKEIFKRLAAVSDVVLVNYRAGVMDSLRLGYTVLQELNPQIIMVLMPGFGTSGPYKDYSSLGNTLEALTGAASLTGYPDRDPLNSNLTWPDPVSGVMTVGVIAAALYNRRRTGQGMLVEIPQMQVAIRAIGGQVMDYVMNGRAGQRMGNRHPNKAPHGCYRCAGDDQWIAIAVGDEKEWRSLCEAIGRPELAQDPRFSEPIGRLERQGELDAIVEEWTSAQDKREAMNALQKAGVPAGAVMTPAEHFSDPHFEQRGFFDEVPNPGVGTYRFQTVNGFRLSKSPGGNRRHAPAFGEHNRYLLHDLLGMDEEELLELQARKIISDRPLANAPRAI